MTAPQSGAVTVTTGLRSTTFVRYAHTDIRVPDFSDYRRNNVKDPTTRSRDSADSRKSFTYLITGSELKSFNSKRYIDNCLKS